MGINLPKALDRARAEGKDMLTVFLQLSNEAVRGDLSKLPLLFTDAQMLQGVRALITGSQQLQKNLSDLDNVDGSTLKDFNQIAADSASKIQDLSNAWDRFALSAGAKLSDYVTPTLDRIAKFLDEMDTASRATSGLDPKRVAEDKADFLKRYAELHGKDKGVIGGRAGKSDFNRDGEKAYNDALQKVGRGEIKDIFTELQKEADRRKILDKYIERADSHPGPRPAMTKGRPSFAVRRGMIPIPIPRPDPNAPPESALNAQAGYPNRSYRASGMMTEAQVAERIRDAQLSSVSQGLGFGNSKVPGLAATGYSGPQPVTLSGPVVTQPSGVQKVEMINPTRPNVTINVTVPVQQTNGDPHAIGQGVGTAVLNGIEGAFSDSGR